MGDASSNPTKKSAKTESGQVDVADRCVLLSVPCSDEPGTRNFSASPDLFLLSIPARWICISQYVSMLSLLFEQERCADWTAHLAAAGFQVQAGGIRDIDTHLREQAHAAFIVVVGLMPLALTLALVSFLDVVPGATTPAGAGCMTRIGSTCV